jgi:hypothetical protein
MAKRRFVLIAEDEPDTANLLQFHLQRRGYTRQRPSGHDGAWKGRRAASGDAAYNVGGRSSTAPRKSFAATIWG